MQSLTLHLNGTHPHHPTEDALSSNQAATVLAVADGVTRSLSPDGTYPLPSPAKLAADVFCDIVQTELAGKPATEQSVQHGFQKANQAIHDLANQLELIPPNYYDRDLPGAVAALAIVDGKQVACGFIGDCGVAVISRDGSISWQTTDDVAHAVKNFLPRHPEQTPKERQTQIRRDFRNKPGTAYGYGVLTGEPDALAFVKTFAFTLQPTDTLVVYSDGALPTVMSTEGRQALMSLSASAVEAVVHKLRSDAGNEGPEATVIAVRL